MAPPLPTKIALEIVTPTQHSSARWTKSSCRVRRRVRRAPGHTPLLAVLQTGRMWYRQGKDKHFLAVSMGFAEVLPDRVTVLAQIAEEAERARRRPCRRGHEARRRMAAGRPASRSTSNGRGWRSCGTLQELRSRGPEALRMFANLKALVRYRGLIQTPRRTRPQGALSRIGARVLLVLHQPAAAAPHLLVRLHRRSARRAPAGDRAIRAVHVLRHPAVDLVFLVADGVVWRPHRGRKSDQEGAVSRPKSCPSSPCSRTWCTSSSGCRSSPAS